MQPNCSNCETLREEIRQPRADLAPPDLTTRIRDRMGFALGPARVLSPLLAHKIRTAEQLNASGPNAPKLGIVRVYIHDLRKAGVEIKTIGPRLYSLPDAERSRIADLLSVSLRTVMAHPHGYSHAG